VAFEQSPVEVRQDVLTYTSTPFAKPLRLVGDVKIAVSLSTSVRDTDLIARLVDVHPDGKAYNLTETGLRLRYLNGYERPQLLEPGQVYLATITGLVTATELREGHSLRVQITSSNFPNYERNLNTGGRNFDESVPVIARTRILHDATHPSYVEFPVLEQ
jgi:putative CocE/NonD family hydrolase